MKIYIDAAHSPLSPGAVFGGRREWDDCRTFSFKLAQALDGVSGVKTRTGRNFSLSPSDRLKKAISCGFKNIVVLHRACFSGTGYDNGCSVFLPSFSGSGAYEAAGELLCALCSAGGFRYRGVHSFSKSNPHISLRDSPAENVFLFELGFIDNAEDNRRLDLFSDAMAAAFAGRTETLMKGTGAYEDIYPL